MDRGSVVDAKEDFSFCFKELTDTEIFEMLFLQAKLPNFSNEQIFLEQWVDGEIGAGHILYVKSFYRK